MSALSTRETGQYAFASFAICSNFEASIPGTQPVRSRWIALIVQLPSTCYKESAAFVDNSCGVNPERPRNAESAIVKQPACAAAINSSGFVPGAFSNRVVNEYGVLLRTPPGADNVPLPCFKSPFQTA